MDLEIAIDQGESLECLYIQSTVYKARGGGTVYRCMANLPSGGFVFAVAREEELAVMMLQGLVEQGSSREANAIIGHGIDMLLASGEVMRMGVPGCTCGYCGELLDTGNEGRPKLEPKLES